VILSGYHSKLYDRLYKDWKAIEFTEIDNANNYKVEVIWLNKKAASIKSLSLFAL
jgi:hypothetical protein